MRVVSKEGLLCCEVMKNKTSFKYPLKSLAEVAFKENYYSSTFVPSPFWYKNDKGSVSLYYLKTNDWSILANNYFPVKKLKERFKNLDRIKSESKEKRDIMIDELLKQSPFFELARDVARFGPFNDSICPPNSGWKICIIRQE